MVRGTDRFRDFKVTVEYDDGGVYEWEVDKNLWYRHLYKCLEEDESVIHYTAEKVFD